MSALNVTLIDVGWGDSILIESREDNGNCTYALVDSNDSSTFRSSFLFLKKFFERKGLRLPDDKPLFEFVLLTHAHTDHGQGLRAAMREFGTRNFFYPKSLDWSGMTYLIRYANRSKTNVKHHQSVDSTKIMWNMGDATIKILWPPHDHMDRTNENNNSVVLVLKLGNISFVLTGDAEEEVWDQVAGLIPQETRFFKVPHHGSVNGTFNENGQTPWFDTCPEKALLGISSHVRPFSHPHRQVIDLFQNNRREYFRTDEHYHVSFMTDGADVGVKYSHV